MAGFEEYVLFLTGIHYDLRVLHIGQTLPGMLS